MSDRSRRSCVLLCPLGEARTGSKMDDEQHEDNLPCPACESSSSPPLGSLFLPGHPSPPPAPYHSDCRWPPGVTSPFLQPWCFWEFCWLIFHVKFSGVPVHQSRKVQYRDYWTFWTWVDFRGPENTYWTYWTFWTKACKPLSSNHLS
jgi:hypothetical protein